MDQNFYEKILDSLSDGVYFVNRKRQVLYWNKAAENLSGYTSEEVIGKRCADNTLNHVDEYGNKLCLKGCPLGACMRDGQSREMNVYMHHKSGHRIPVRVRSFPMRDEAGKIMGSVEIFSDNSQRLAIRTEVEALRHEVLTDPLSGIGNRRYADISLENMYESLKRDNVPFGVLFVDVDNFKSINDKWGHDIGDRVIATVAKTLSVVLRPLDVACRWGGDEYVILISNASLEGLAAIGKRIIHLIEESWFALDDDVVSFSASIGGALSKKSDTAKSILERADKQLYLSKENGRNCFHLDDIAIVTTSSENSLAEDTKLTPPSPQHRSTSYTI
ncbi:sensor domain-containing diguanylate cyclase [Cohaesibacter celericrescens]|uniref:Sensor domain-containing diguanylate cyclase n=1 Tax=Cohaesibacter celericrescens TaxID=2067669 RepID=A0A2N5XQ93_9HYPH|nr:sensor domain-containing diguanylate cyclase [Cohaesibacter celericrescens]PLW76664.1 sensor domain-containing diguanylate cyclase [Cohaesibacter celericrescens]